MLNKIISLSFFLALFYTHYGQNKTVTISGIAKDKANATVLAYVNIVLLTQQDSAFVMGTLSNEEGRFSLAGVIHGNYLLSLKLVGYQTYSKSLFIGQISPFLDLSSIELTETQEQLSEVEITGKQNEVNSKMDKKTYAVDANISQGGGSVLQTMQTLPGVTVQDGKVQLRGNEKVMVLIDGKQTALTGIGGQSGLDNIPASAIERIEIINNPSAKYDANGNGGIINIVFKKEKKDGFNGKAGFTTGVGSLWVRKENLPGIRPQYQFTPKLNPSLSINYRKKNLNFFLQADNLYIHTLNKNEFVTRKYNDGTVILQQLKRNRNTNFFTSKAGFDWKINESNSLTISGLFGNEKIIDRGDQPFFKSDLSEQIRLWQFLEDELKTTVMATVAYQHRFKQAGHLINAGYNYTFHREDEKYFFDNIMPTYQGKDAFKLISDEKVNDFNIDYIKPTKNGRLESGFKFRIRNIPTNMLFIPGINSPLDTNAGGQAIYKEIIPALYANYVYESKKFESEIGIRMEYVGLKYDVNPNHNTYKSDGYSYTQPFPNIRISYKISDRNKVSIFYNRRVDRPNEVDIRIFPKYDDAEIIKVGNPALRPQFTNSFDFGYKSSWRSGYLYSAIYHRIADGTITRISTIFPGSNIIYSVFQNVNRSNNSGIEIIIDQRVSTAYAFNLSMNAYQNKINAFSVENKYPQPHTFTANTQEIFSGNIKLNNIFHFVKKLDAQLTVIYMAPDIIPQGKIASRFTLDCGIKKIIQKGKGEVFLNASDILGTMVIKKEIQGNGFIYTSNDYYETQVIRVGYSYKF